MWFLFQFGVVLAVLFGNIHYQWTPNPYLPILLGWVAAFIMTLLISLAYMMIRDLALFIVSQCRLALRSGSVLLRDEPERERLSALGTRRQILYRPQNRH